MSFVFQDINIISNPALWRRWSWTSFPRRRLLVWFTYWVDARLWGDNASGWRLTSFVIHGVNVALVATISPVAALLFFVHPLATMGHSYVAGRSGTLQTTFQLTAIVAVLHDHLLVALVIALVATLWVKEDSITFLPMVVAAWLIF